MGSFCKMRLSDDREPPDAGRWPLFWRGWVLVRTWSRVTLAKTAAIQNTRNRHILQG